MQFNDYTTYSIISNTEKQNQSEYQKFLDLIQTFDGIKTSVAAKDYLKVNYGIKDNVQKFPISNNGFLYVKESLSKYSVRLVYDCANESECIVYSYQK